jgi:hypothetical protein
VLLGGGVLFLLRQLLVDFNEMGLGGSGAKAERDGHKFWYNAYWKTDPAK